MPDGTTLAAFVLLIGLLAAWAQQRACDERRDESDRNHRLRRRLHAHLDQWAEDDYRAQLRFDLEIGELLDERRAA